MPNLSPSGAVSSEGDLQARDIITGIQVNFNAIFQHPFEPPPDLAQLRRDYLAYLRHCYRHLDMKGILQVQQVTQQLSLAAIYVPLQATSQQAAPGELLGRVAGRHQRWPGEADPGELAATVTARPTEPVRIEAALKDDPAVVVLGDPGAGKSTLLKVLALALADESTDHTLPLPILLPLNAYARRLQQGEINLGRYVGDYYATRQQKLKQVGALFDDALKQGQAVILLDGLDEVQADRQYLVRLVQDFVGEYIPQPAALDDPAPAGPQGNRIVVTSRIVGYQDAPLAGRQWRTYTLTDFDDEDIAQFVDNWTLAFTVSIHGDNETTRHKAAQERDELLAAINSRPSVKRLASNPLLLTILSMIKYTGVTLPEQRVKLYELYLEALIESWNLARSLDQKPVGPGINYQETVQVLAPLALWLRQENPTAGLVSRRQLEQWLTDYYHGDEWGLPKGEARQRGRDFLKSVESYSNLLLERGERQYGFLHLTLEEMLAAKGLALLYFDDAPAALALFERYLTEPGWHETLQLAVGAVGIVQQLPPQAGAILLKILQMTPIEIDPGYPAVFAGQVLLDVGSTNVGRPATKQITDKLVETMQAAANPIRIRRDAGQLLGRLGWQPKPAPDDRLLAPTGSEPSGLDAFRRIESLADPIWLGKYPVTNAQFARFIDEQGYDNDAYWSDDGWAWRTGSYDSQATEKEQEWLKHRPPDKRQQPFYWDDQKWNNPLNPVVGVSWFEAEAYCRWLTQRTGTASQGQVVRLPHETEWTAAMAGQGAYPWGETFDRTHLNCAEAWVGREFKEGEWNKWLSSDEESWREATTTAVVTYPQGSSLTGVWDGSGNVWEWLGNPYDKGSVKMVLRGGSWYNNGRYARVSSRSYFHPDSFGFNFGFRAALAPIIS